MQIEATISADIIDSTSLDSGGLSRLRDYLIHFDVNSQVSRKRGRSCRIRSGRYPAQFLHCRPLRNGGIVDQT